MSFTDYLEDALLKHVFTNTSYTSPTTIYVGLHTSADTDASAGTEVSGSGYARQSASFSVSGTNPTEATTSAAIEFPAATASWGTVSYAAVYDASSGGNRLAWAQLTDPSDFSTALPKTIETGDVFRISAGNLKVRLD
jgi:hypothetical protein